MEWRGSDVTDFEDFIFGELFVQLCKIYALLLLDTSEVKVHSW